jgi:hypothetical protein
VSLIFYAGLIVWVIAAILSVLGLQGPVSGAAFFIGLILVIIGLRVEPGTLPQIKGNSRGIKPGVSHAGMSGIFEGDQPGKNKE